MPTPKYKTTIERTQEEVEKEQELKKQIPGLSIIDIYRAGLEALANRAA